MMRKMDSIKTLPHHHRVRLLHSLLKGQSIKKSASLIGVGGDVVTRFLFSLGKACRSQQDRMMKDLPFESVHCGRHWAFTYVRRRNAYDPESNRAIPPEGWVWVATHPASGLIVDWSVSSGGGAAAADFLTKVAARMARPMELVAKDRALALRACSEKADPSFDQMILQRRFGNGPGETERASSGLPTAERASFDLRCFNLHQALALHFVSYNLIGDGDHPPSAVKARLIDRPWETEDLLSLLGTS